MVPSGGRVRKKRKISDSPDQAHANDHKKNSGSPSTLNEQKESGPSKKRRKFGTGSSGKSIIPGANQARNAEPQKIPLLGEPSSSKANTSARDVPRTHLGKINKVLQLVGQFVNTIHLPSAPSGNSGGSKADSKGTDPKPLLSGDNLNALVNSFTSGSLVGLGTEEAAEEEELQRAIQMSLMQDDETTETSKKIEDQQFEINLAQVLARSLAEK